MLSAGEFRKGQTVEIDGAVWVIVDFQHVKPGKGAAFVRTKIKNVVNGNVLERTFSPTERYPRAHVETKSMEYLYNDGDLYYFMDNETYEQLPLNRELVEDAMQYVKENTSVDVKFFKGQAFSVEAPNFVELAITQTDPGIKGDTATGGTKPATLETGAVVNVPLFVNEGDVIRVDTRGIHEPCVIAKRRKDERLFIRTCCVFKRPVRWAWYQRRIGRGQADFEDHRRVAGYIGCC